LRYIFLYLALFSLGDYTQQNNFTGGKYSPLMEARTDFEKYKTGLRQLENMIPRPQGDVSKRPGTKFIAQIPSEVCFDNTVAYPILHELDSSEIPARPAAPIVDDGSIPIPDPENLTDTPAEQLQAMGGSNKYILTADIDLDEVAWIPITNFSGVLDGDGHTISNLTVGTTLVNNQGLFGTMIDGAQVKDLTLDNFNITANDYAGCLVARISGGDNITFLDINVTDSTVTGADDYIGGMIGSIVTGATGNIKIRQCEMSNNTISPSNQSRYVGGMIAELYANSGATASEIVSCTNIGGTVYGKDEMGGLIGYVYGKSGSEVNIHTCRSTAAVTLSERSLTCVGGLIGTAYYADITTCYATGNIATDSQITYCNDTGGFIGLDGGANTFINCYATGNLSSGFAGGDISYWGGFVGWSNGLGSSYLRCYATGDIIVDNDSTSYYVGGFVGLTYNATFSRCYSWGDITIDDGNSCQGIGGFCGYNLEEGATFENCYCWGKITITNSTGFWRGLGGFLGLTNVAGNELISDVTITNCYCAQTVDKYGSTHITDGLTQAGTTYGGFVGLDGDATDFGAVTTNCFYDKQTCGFEADDSTATAYNTDLMQTKSTYTDAGWQFSTKDGIKDNINSIWTMPTGGQTCYQYGIDDPIRLIPFEYSTGDTYIIAFGKNSIGFYRDGAQIEE
jgi:hypothetical protein